MASLPVTSQVSKVLGDLFSRMATEKEGIEYRLDGQWLDAPLGPDDKHLFDLVAVASPMPRKLAIGLPRVPAGASTWLALAGMVARLILASHPGLPPAPAGRTSTSILVASRDRSVRDLYLTQRLRFGNQSFPTDRFPAYRVRRDGRMASICPQAPLPNPLSVPVVFYHFDPVDRIDGSIGLILGEMVEEDARLSDSMVRRLEAIRDHVHGPPTLLLFNSFDDHLRMELPRAGYEVRHVRPSRAPTDDRPLMPTLASLSARFALDQTVRPDVVPDEDVSSILYEAALALSQLARSVAAPDAKRLLGTWWQIWRTLKDLTVPLPQYERYRLHSLGRPSLEAAIARVRLSAERLECPEAGTLKAVAPAVSARLYALYNAVRANESKSGRLLEVLSALAEDRQHVRQTLVVLSEKGQVGALHDDLLFSDTALLEHLPPVVHLARAVEQARKVAPVACVLPGVWAPWHEPLVVGLGAQTLRPLLYPYESSLMLGRLAQHATECAALASHMFAPHTEYPPVISVTRQDADALATCGQRSQASPEEEPRFVEPLDVDDGFLDVESVVERDGGPRISITFSDGLCITVGPQVEFLRVGDEVDSVRSDQLETGDRVAVIDDHASRALFDDVLAKVNHLVHADPRVIELWRASLDRLCGGATRTPDTVRRAIADLRGRGCTVTDQAMSSWFRGTTLAPRDARNVRRVLEASGVQHADDVGRVVVREVNTIRNFNRRLGARIRAQIRAEITHSSVRPTDRLDIEIDEALEAVSYKTVMAVRVIGD
jgi:hypothetical protein